MFFLSPYARIIIYYCNCLVPFFFIVLTVTVWSQSLYLLQLFGPIFYIYYNCTFFNKNHFFISFSLSPNVPSFRDNMSTTNKCDHSINGDNQDDDDPDSDDMSSTLGHHCCTHCPAKFLLESHLTR